MGHVLGPIFYKIFYFLIMITNIKFTILTILQPQELCSPPGSSVHGIL